MAETDTDENKAAQRRVFDFKDILLKVPLHPFVFAALPIIMSLYDVKKLVLPEEIIPCVMVSEGATTILLVVSLLVLKNVTKAAIITTLTLGLFFSYRLLAYAIEAASTGIIGHAPPTAVTLVIYTCLCAICLPSSLKERWDFGKFAFELDLKKLSMSLNILSVVLLIFNSLSLISFEVEDNALSEKYTNRYKTAFDNVQVNNNAEKPDVYYFIVDGFASKWTMNDMFNVHDDQLFDYLKDKGFYVVPKARSNYDRTELSLSSTFNMQYIDDIPGELGKGYDGLNLFCRMVQDSAMRRTFKRLGYTFVNVSSGNSATDWIYVADKNIRLVPFNHFMTAVAQLTPLYATEEYFP